jgi:hypothetical protein
MQREWPVLSSFALIGIVETPPHWVAASAKRALAQLPPGELAACRAQLPMQAQLLMALHRRWVVAAVLAILLALTMISSAQAMPLDGMRLGVLISALSAVLLPPLVICNGIARDYVAARALVLVMKGAIQPDK